MTESNMVDEALQPEESVTDSGWLSFAGLLILLLGIVNALEGLLALSNERYGAFIAGSFYLFNLKSWGWIHLLLGLILIAVGIGILAGQEWARLIGIGLAGAAAVIQMLYLSSSPTWAFINVLLCTLVIYALVVPPRGAIAG